MEQAGSFPETDPGNSGKKRRRRQLTILIACVLIATVLWFLRALENEYTTRVDHPLSYINLPDKMVTMNPLPQRVSLEVKGLGFSVLRHNWDFYKTPLIIDFQKLRSGQLKRKKGFTDYIPMNQYYGDFSVQLQDLKVIAIVPDTLVFRFAFNRSKIVKVVPLFIYDSGTSIIPDSLIKITPVNIEVTGPDLILDTLRFIRTQPIRIGKQNNGFIRSFGLEDLHRLVKTKPEKVNVAVSKIN